MSASDSHRYTATEAETVEQTLARLEAASETFTEPELLRPSRWMRLGNLLLPILPIIGGASVLASQRSNNLESWAIRALGAAVILAGIVGWLAAARGRVLLAPEGMMVRRILSERTIPWKELSAINLHCDHSYEDGDQHGLAVTTERGEAIELPGFRTVFWLGGKSPPPSMVVAADRIRAWKRRYDPPLNAPETAPAGWYPDSTNAGRLRYWQGTSWTDRFATDAPTSHPGLHPPEDTSV